MAAKYPTSSNQDNFCPNRSDIQFLSYKCKTAFPILKENWDVLLPQNQDFLTLVDREKVAFGVGVKELNSILISGYFTPEEAKVIKKFRYQMRNNFAARKMRDNYRKLSECTEYEILDMTVEKDILRKEKENLSWEIQFYQRAMSELAKIN